jgi:hypothetical protein
MARGWESKSVEEQQSLAADKSSSSRPQLSPQQAARQREVENLRLARQRVVQQLAANPAPGYGRVLETALVDLDEKLRLAESQA